MLIIIFITILVCYQTRQQELEDRPDENVVKVYKSKRRMQFIASMKLNAKFQGGKDKTTLRAGTQNLQEV